MPDTLPEAILVVIAVVGPKDPVLVALRELNESHSQRRPTEAIIVEGYDPEQIGDLIESPLDAYATLARTENSPLGEGGLQLTPVLLLGHPTPQQLHGAAKRINTHAMRLRSDEIVDLSVCCVLLYVVPDGDARFGGYFSMNRFEEELATTSDPETPMGRMHKRVEEYGALLDAAGALYGGAACAASRLRAEHSENARYYILQQLETAIDRAESKQLFAPTD